VVAVEAVVAVLVQMILEAELNVQVVLDLLVALVAVDLYFFTTNY
jgi:hypothetical protein